MAIIYTIGHSTRSLQDFLALLRAYDINQLIDIRTIPKSRHNPQFNQDTFSTFLRSHRIGYRHMKGLGGLRHAHKDSINRAWRNASFRGYADYMQTAEFEKNLKKLIEIARKKTVVIMCSEAVPWRCHRSLIGDALLVHKLRVYDIYSIHSTKEHTLTPWARVVDKHVIYP